MKTKTIRQTVKFAANPKEVYEALMNSKGHSEFTESAARISKTVGGKITAYAGYIEGKNIKLIPNKKIVQEWRAADWPKGHFSTATFELKKAKNGSVLKFKQEGVPAQQYSGINKGWKEHYWNKMKRYLENV